MLMGGLVVLLCFVLDEASCTGCCWRLSDAGSCIRVAFLCVSSHYLILSRVVRVGL